VERHRRGRPRQGPRHVRGRDDARAAPRRRPRRDGQTHPEGAHRGERRRLDGHRGGASGAGGCARARAHGRLREAVRERRDVGSLAEVPVPGAAHGGRRRFLRAARARVHQALAGTARRGDHGRGEGSSERAPEPLRAPPHVRCLARDREGVPHAVGSDSLPGDVSLLRRSVRHGPRQRGGRETCAATARVGSGDRGAQRADALRRTQPGRIPRRAATAPRTSTPGRHHEPAGRARRRRDLRSVQLVRADVAGEPRLCRRRRGLAHDGGRGDGHGAAICP
jgi:hypothetical protein